VGLLDALQQLVISPWRFVNLQCDPGHLTVIAQVTRREVGRCISLTALLPPVPPAEN
jgi:hypothetical protein